MRTADSMVVRKITWQYEVVYTVGGQPTMYEQLSMPLFVTVYLAVVYTVKSGFKEAMLKHLQKLMANATTYRWELVYSNHIVWL